jgi:biopolymer transport protein ExbD
MIAIERPRKPRQMENTIALINIVFLMLVFFLIAGTIAPPIARDIQAISTQSQTKPEAPDGTLAIKADGSLVINGRPVTIEDYTQTLASADKGTGTPVTMRLLPDRNLPATKLLDVINALHAATGDETVILSERASP